jgi:hypothetical protein
MHRSAARSLSALLVLSAASVAACGEDGLPNPTDLIPDTENARAAEGVESAHSSSLELALLAGLTRDVPIGEPADMAQEAQGLADGVFIPGSCVTAVAAANTVSYVLQDCSTSLGVAGVTGAASLVFESTTDGTARMIFTATGLQLNGRTLTSNITGEMSTNDQNARTWNSILSSVSTARNEQPQARAGTVLSTLEGECLVMNGSVSTEIERVVWSTTFQNLRRCEGACPAGGTVIYSSADLGEDPTAPGIEAITFTFAGESRIAWVEHTGRPGFSSLSCGE